MTHRSDLPDALHELLRKTEAAYPDRAHLVWEHWEEAVGAELAKRSSPLELRRGRLVVAVSSAPWMQQLSFLREQLREALNAAVGQEIVREIRFRVKTVDPPPPPRKPAPPPAWLDQPLPDDALAAIDRDVSVIADPALRSVVRDVRRRAAQVALFREVPTAPGPRPSTSPSGSGGTEGAAP